MQTDNGKAILHLLGSNQRKAKTIIITIELADTVINKEKLLKILFLKLLNKLKTYVSIVLM